MIFPARSDPGLLPIALLLLLFFIVEGMSKVIFALSIRRCRTGSSVLASGIVGILLALLLWTRLSSPTVWLIGILIGVQLIGEGERCCWAIWPGGWAAAAAVRPVPAPDTRRRPTPLDPACHSHMKIVACHPPQPIALEVVSRSDPVASDVIERTLKPEGEECAGRPPRSSRFASAWRSIRTPGPDL